MVVVVFTVYHVRSSQDVVYKTHSQSSTCAEWRDSPDTDDKCLCFVSYLLASSIQICGD